MTDDDITFCCGPPLIIPNTEFAFFAPAAPGVAACTGLPPPPRCHPRSFLFRSQETGGEDPSLQHPPPTSLEHISGAGEGFRSCWLAQELMLL